MKYKIKTAQKGTAVEKPENKEMSVREESLMGHKKESEEGSNKEYSGEDCIQHFAERCWHWIRTLKYWHLATESSSEHKLSACVIECLDCFQSKICKMWIGSGKELLPFGPCTEAEKWERGSEGMKALLQQIYDEAMMCKESDTIGSCIESEFEEFLASVSKYRYEARFI